MAISLTNFGIDRKAGEAALLPNQPILHNCIVAAENNLQPGDIVTLSAQAGNNDAVIVKKAAVTEKPVGVVVYNCIKSGFVAGDRVSVFPEDAYVYLPANGAITRGAKLQFTAAGKVAATTTSSNGYVGVAMTAAAAADELIVVQIKPSL